MVVSLPCAQKVLNEAGYVPSNTEKYPLGGIVSAIQNAFHATPKLACRNGAVEELNICFYKDFKVRLLRRITLRSRYSYLNQSNYTLVVNRVVKPSCCGSLEMYILSAYFSILFEACVAGI